MRSRLLAALAVVLAGCSTTPSTTIAPLDTNVSSGEPTSSLRPLTTEAAAPADLLAPQPGAEWVAFRSPRPDGRDGVFLARPDGSDRHQLVADLPFVQASPALSPDGSRIAFNARHPDEALSAVDPDGSDAT